ncbi:tumor necrosis factor receptor superfamily member 14 isoform X1 [Coregonus clupeaformis]|uniref:tumor necrosis factor receptor superfamily member 14 isoform X1 n=1 Tax=Coregonus clupeaformis TaxID=59861 RepID=UPI001BDF7E6D|nr:tumor necrosis factor receptor superfamily member 14 isoform X1 [Coregonus clupeaformis]
MARLECKTKEYLHDASGVERCCERCHKGQYVRTDCGKSTKTECETCQHEYYTAELNSLKKCLPCRVCHSSNNQRVWSECEASRDRQCVCVTGFYCTDDGCEHCLPVTLCPLGSGVVNEATPHNDTVCAPCLPGTYNNISDAITRCQTHTRCGDLGREVKSAGTETTDAVCDVISRCPSLSGCPWILPTSLWAGLVVTSLLIIILICIYWRAKRQSYMPANSSGPGIPVEPATPSFASAELKFPTECNSHWSLDQKGTEPLFINTAVIQVNGCTSDCEVESNSATITMTASERFSQSDHSNGMRGNYIRPSRYLSEPQEDEWPGT